jgi:plastocyanin
MPQHDIDVTAMSFPADTRVAKGDTVRWTNKMSMIHTVTADVPPSPPRFDSGDLGENASFQHVFNDAGAFPYHCQKHPGRMKGKVTVT